MESALVSPKERFQTTLQLEGIVSFYSYFDPTTKSARLNHCSSVMCT